MTAPLVVEVVRSSFVESRHLVDVAVVNRSGDLVSSAGDPATVAAFRSSAKPIQARAALEAGWTPRDDASLAIACASHNGEQAHVEQARAVLRDAGVSEEALRCPLDVPAYPQAALAVGERARIYHNCSGKHASMLAACVASAWPLEGYRDDGHPLQDRVRAHLERAGIASAPLVDGCGVPTYTGTLTAFARAFLAIDDGGPEAAAMRAHPFLVGGSERFDTDLMSVLPHVLTKAGAEGLACVSTGELGIALKSRDGFAMRARGPSVMLVLRTLGIVGDAEIDKLARHVEVPVLGGGEQVGVARARGELARR